jgi:hypothetical protein
MIHLKLRMSKYSYMGVACNSLSVKEVSDMGGKAYLAKGFEKKMKANTGNICTGCRIYFEDETKDNSIK